MPFAIIIIILILLNVFLIIKKRKSLETNTESISRLEKRLKDLISEKANLISIFSHLFDMEYSKLFGYVKVKNEENREINFKNLFTTSKLVLFMPEKVCNSCYENLFSELQKFSKKAPENSIITIAALSKFREMKSFYKEYKLDLNIYGVANQKVGTEINNDLLAPLFFVTDSSLICRNLFIPDQYNSQLTRNYLNAMGKRYWSMEFNE